VSILDEDALRALIREAVREAVREELAARPAAPGEYVSVADAARIAAVSPGTVRDWLRAGRLTTYQAGRVKRLRVADLETFLRSPPSSAEISPEEAADTYLRRRRARR
jgi:excisionase family DNA binding protein